jgi:hypothetical protein
VNAPLLLNVPLPPLPENAGALAGFVQLMLVAPGQLAESVELEPCTIEDGLAVTVQLGGAGCETTTTAVAGLPVPYAFVPFTE